MILKRHKSFVKGFRKTRITDKQFEKFIAYIALIQNDKNLPIEAIDHRLQGEYSDCREFHLGGDLLVIYLVNKDIATLIRIGSHSQLF